MEFEYKGDGPYIRTYFPAYGDHQAKESYDTFMEAKLEAIRPILNQEIEAAHAPYTQRALACVVETESGAVYGGHTIEQPSKFISPVDMILAKVADNDDKITMVWLSGTGTGIRKPKHLMPSSESYDRLAPLLDQYTPFFVLEPTRSDAAFIISPDCYKAAYAPKPYSEFDGTTDEVQEQIWRDTLLEREDSTLFTALHHMGKEIDTEYYLTGSSSGRGGVSDIFTDFPEYGDMDIIAVTSMSRTRAEEHFEELAEIWYKGLTKEPHNVRAWPSGEIIEGVTYRGECYERLTPVAIDFFVARSLASAMVRSEYRDRNFYHKIS